MRLLHPFLLATIGFASMLPAQLAGAYVVGPGGHYANMTAAIAALTTSGVAGPVSFLVISTNETGPWTIGAIPGQGPNRPILFDGSGAVTIGGTQPVLTLNGCDSVTFRGFNGTFTNTPSSFVISGSTANCAFVGCNLTAPTATSGQALFSMTGGTDFRIEDSTFGGAYESIYVQAACARTTIRRCNILGGGFWIMRLAGSDIVLENNFITGPSNYGISAGVSGNTSSGANLKIRNNSVFINHPTTSSQYCSLRWYSGAAGTEVVNNIFFDNYQTTAALNMWCSGALRPTLMDYNCLWCNIAGYNSVYAGANLTFAGWQALGFDTNSISADPMYTLPTFTPPILDLLPGSPCGTAGTLIPAVTTDNYGVMRTVPYSIGAHELLGGVGASYNVFGGGCAGTAGVASNTAWPTPALGSTSTVTFGNLPSPYVVAMVMGFSNTQSMFGPLPMHLAAFGAPGCLGRVSLDLPLFVAGSNGSASTNLTVPNLQNLIGMQVFTQGLVLDPLANPMGAVVSDAARILVGL